MFDPVLTGNEIVGSHDHWLVLLSYIIAVFASYTALDLGIRIGESYGTSKKIWIGGCALAMGGGIWSMHFTAMLAFKSTLAITYNIWITLLSLQFAVFASGIGFYMANHRPTSISNIVKGGVFMGIGVAAMHYTGMAAMKFSGSMHFKSGLFILSILIAMLAATAALWLTIHFSKKEGTLNAPLKIAGALIMGLAVFGMHYTGMSATILIPQESSSSLEIQGVYDSQMLAFSISGITTFILSLTVLASLTQKEFNRLKGVKNELEFLVQERTRAKDEAERANQAKTKVLQEMELKNRQLNESEARIRGIMDNVVDAIITIDVNGTIVSFNSSAEKIFGYNVSEVLGKNINMLMPEPYRTEHDSYIQRYLDTNLPKIIGIGREVTGMKKDRSTFSLDLAISEVFLSGRYLFTGIARDITQRNEEKKALVQAMEEAEQANQAKSEFLSRMSHELRTPMNAILGFSQLLEYNSEEPLTESQKTKVREIIKAGSHLLELINEVLEISHIESGKLSLSIENVNLQELIEEAILLIIPLAQQRNIRIVNCTSDNPISLYGLVDRTKLKQVILNLMSNAVKYNQEQGSVVLDGLKTTDGRIRLGFTDTGNGISKEQQTQIFEPFNRVDADKTEIEGTGIGLTITKRLLESMDGSISLESNLGKGSCFTIELPGGKEVHSPKQLEPAPYQKTEQPQPSSGEQHTLLYVEDNPANLNLVEQILNSRSDIQLLSASRAHLGIDLARAHLPDLILMDIHMPEMDGITAMKVLRTHKETRDIPIIAISANAMQSDIKKAMAEGFNSYITKPFNIEKFFIEIDRFLKSKNSSLAESPQ